MARDTLIFRVSPTGLSLVGGEGRGVGWTGIVDLPLAGEALAARVHARGHPYRISEPEPIRVVGPYWARHAVLVPVGAEHLIVFGDRDALPDSAVFVSRAAQLVAELQQVSPTKLLADELEVVRAIRDLMEYRPEELRATARHIATRVAESLSCEVGAVLVRSGGESVAEVITRDWPARLDADAIRDRLLELYARAGAGPVLEPDLEEATGDALGRAAGLVARLTLPLGEPPFGVLVVAHAAARPRGFTNLCQRIGQVLAQAAESLLSQALAREELSADRDRFAQEARTDPLTGLGNRLAWREEVARESLRQARYERSVSFLIADLDGLKAVNDRFGHRTGDELICTAAGLLKSHTRSADFVARIGGDEFIVMLPETDTAGARRIARRIRDGARRLPPVAAGQGLGLSLGAATVRPGETIESAIHRADVAMYRSKSRRGRPGRS